MLSLHPQLSSKNSLAHLLSIQDLPASILKNIIILANKYIDENFPTNKNLHGKTVANLFFENSTRTKSSFELASQKLGAHTISLNIATSSTAKGESLTDTVSTIVAMGADIVVIRHSESGALFSLLPIIKNTHIINAGDGGHEHPTQALLDVCTIGRHKQNDFPNLKVAIIGDILHSRVARSDIFALSILGCSDIRVIAPANLLPHNIEELGVKPYYDTKQGLQDVDVVITLRLQKERMQSSFIPDINEYYQKYGLDAHKLSYCAPNAIVMHPGPLNRGVEICTTVADGNQSVILEQVRNGIGVRMAVMDFLINSI